MSGRTILYGKNNGERPVPMTVRIEWLPDGTIKPLMYWTPDDSCFEVMTIIECTPLAFLRERGEGLRFKVRSEMIEADPADADQLHTRHETYIYLADRRFSEKNIIDARYSHPSKEYIPVTLDVFPDGDYELLCFTVGGQRYRVEQTKDIELRGSFQAGGVGLRHKVEVRQVNAGDDDDPDPKQSVRRTAALYWELNKWFVSVAKTE